ncbi:MAG: hypothetical protein NXI32_13895 [bacterium]|nr:hypothetical protein [bacterium]
MSRSGHCILVSTTDGWHLVRPHATASLVAPRDAAPTEIARLCLDAVASPRKTEILLLLDSEEFLFHCFDLADVAGSRKRRPLVYRLEADLPLNAEDIIADFQFESTKVSPRVSAVAADVRRIRPLIEELNELGFKVKSVTPRSLVLTQWLATSSKLAEPYLLLLNRPTDDAQAEVFVVENGLLVGWRLLRDQRSVPGELKMLLLGNESSNLYVAGDVPEEDDFSSITAMSTDTSDRSANLFAGHAYTLLPVDLDRAQREAEQRLLAGRIRPSFDLADDPGLNKLTSQDDSWRKQLVTTVALCALMMTIACLWRSERLATAVDDLRQRQASIFRETFPGQKIPAAVQSRLQSEYTKLVNSKTLEDGAVAMPQAAIPVVRRLLESLPNAPPIGIEELRVNDGEVYLDLIVQEHAQAADLAEQLRKSGFAIAPPTTEATSDSVRAILRGDLRGDLP